jgi:pyridoxal phosphate enzyme (YggS family)
MNVKTVDRIGANLQKVSERIAHAATSAGRNPESIRLLIVTKLQPVEVIEKAIESGGRLFGENYAEEAVPKIAALGQHKKLEWHMIGHIQSRKALMVCQNFDLIETVDSLKIAVRLNRFSAQLNRKIPVLLEFNLGEEESKSGWVLRNTLELENVLAEITQIVGLDYLDVRGLMTMPPLFEQPEQARPFFTGLVRLQQTLRKKLPQTCWDELSMGTSQDFEIAVQEGATIVRIGRAILGPRPEI